MLINCFVFLCKPGVQTARRVGGPKFRAFSLSGGLLVDFWWCLKRRRAQMCTFGVLWLLCEAPEAREPKTAPTLQKHQQNSTRRPQRGKKRNNFAAGEEKKEQNFGRSGEGRSRGWAVHETNNHTTQHTTQQIKLGFGQSRFWPKSVLAKVGHTTKTLILAKVGLAKVGLFRGSGRGWWFALRAHRFAIPGEGEGVS